MPDVDTVRYTTSGDSGFEQHLKELWSRYIDHLERHGFDESADALREQYFQEYRSYRNDRIWKKIMRQQLAKEVKT
jgi:hypothetical protein